MSKAKPQMVAGQVLAVLEDKHFSKGAYQVLREVRNTTGYGKQDRYADALVVSCWPSRGIWFGGVEVKVSRADWLGELRNPAKSAEIQRFCSYWWIATPEGIVQPGELPETWGHIEVTEKSAKLIRAAPKLDAEPPTAGFVASVLRNHAERECERRDRAHRSGYREAEEKFGGADKALLERSAQSEKLFREAAEKQLAELREAVNAFERDTGVAIHRHAGRWAPESPIEQLRKARAAVRAFEHVDLERVAGSLRNAAAQLEQTHAELQAAQASAERQAAE